MSARASAEAPLRMGVVGGGLVAQAVHVPLLRRVPGFEPAALAEPSPAVREAVARRWAVPAAYDDHRAMLAAGDVDAVLVCSPNGTHVDVVLDALDAALPVLVEKPLCIDPADADRIAAARDRAGTVVQVGYMKRFDPAVERLLADVGPDFAPRHLASLTHDPGLRAYFSAPGMPAADVPAAVRDAVAERTREQVIAATGWDPDGSVGAFVETFLGALVHDVNLGLAVLDAAGLEVTGVVDAFGSPDGSLAGGALEATGGVRWSLAWILLEAVAAFSERLIVLGDGGALELEFPAPYVQQAPTRYSRRAGVETRTLTSWAEAYERQLEHFEACVRHGEPCRTPPEQARRDLDVLTALYRAAMARVPAEAVT